MQEWICGLGPYWGSAVGAVAILLGIATAVGILLRTGYLFYWLGKKWSNAGWPTIQMSHEAKEKMANVSAAIFGVVAILLGISLFIYGGFNMWKKACEGLGLM